MTYKYEIIISEGCRSFYTTVNDKLVYGEGETMTREEIHGLIDYLCEKFKYELDHNTVSLDNLIQCFPCDDNEYDEHSCDQCGDTVIRSIYRL